MLFIRYWKANKKDGTYENSPNSSPWIAIPPKNYGGTESVISTLVEAQVAQGHDVTLFAPGDAKISAAEMVQFIPRIDQIDREAPRIHVEQHFSAQVMAENYVKTYEKLIRTNSDRDATRSRIPIGEAAI